MKKVLAASLLILVCFSSIVAHAFNRSKNVFYYNEIPNSTWEIEGSDAQEISPIKYCRIANEHASKLTVMLAVDLERKNTVLLLSKPTWKMKSAGETTLKMYGEEIKGSPRVSRNVEAMALASEVILIEIETPAMFFEVLETYNKIEIDVSPLTKNKDEIINISLPGIDKAMPEIIKCIDAYVEKTKTKA